MIGARLPAAMSSLICFLISPVSVSGLGASPADIPFNTPFVPPTNDHQARSFVSQKRNANKNENNRNEDTSVSEEGVCSLHSIDCVAGPLLEPNENHKAQKKLNPNQPSTPKRNA
jgi:hypothetical protein